MAAAGLTLTLMVVTVIFAASPAGARWNGDLELYHHYAGTFLDGTVSTTPFLSWYPPPTLIPITLPRLLAADLPTYTLYFAIEMCALTGVLLLVTARSCRRAGAGRGAVALLVALALLLVLLIPWRYDVVPALVTAFGLLAALGGAPVAAGAMLGLGAGFKLYPAVLLPVLLLWLWMRGDHRGTLGALLGFVLVAGISFGLYVFFPPTDPRGLVAFQGGRGLQLESLPAAVIGLAAALGLIARPEVAFGDGSYNVLGPFAQSGTALTTVLEPLLLAVALAAIAWRFWRERQAGEVTRASLVMGFATMLLGLILGNRVFSPQYLIWLLPFVVLLPRRFWPPVIAAYALTAILFPLAYDGLIAMDLLPELVLAVRNALLAGLFIWLVAELVLAPAAALSSGPSAYGREAVRT
jgi:hypothetical protein